MSPEEIISNLEVMKAEIEWEYSLEYQLVLENVIGLVGKEIEKPVIVNKYWNDSFNFDNSIKSIQCPMCSRTLKHSKGKLTGRCPNCGQKLDWR